MAEQRRSGPAWVFFVVVALAGCSTAGTGSSTTSATPGTISAPSTSAQANSACANVAAKGQALGAAVLQFFDGKTTGDQVRAAADELASALSAARAGVQADVGARLDDAQAAVQKLVTTLQAQPVDLAGMRTAAAEMLTALGDVATICQSASSPSTSTS